MIKTVTQPFEDTRAKNGEAKWSIVVRLGSKVETHRFTSKGDALTALGKFIAQGYQITG